MVFMLMTDFSEQVRTLSIIFDLNVRTGRNLFSAPKDG